MNELQIFENLEFGQIRVTLGEDGEPLFVAADVCRALEIINHKDAIKRLDEDEKSGVVLTDPHGRPQETNCVTEAGLYSLVLGSRKKEAKQFKRWVIHEVLPSIRKYGVYATAETAERLMNDPDFMIKTFTRLKEEQERSKRLRDLAALQEVEISIMQPKADYFDALVEKNLLTSLRETAKLLNMGEKTLIHWLTCKGYLYRAKGGKLLPTAERAKEGLFAVKEVCDKDRNWFGVQTYVTPKGRETLRLLCERARENVERVLAEYDHGKKSE